MTAKKKTTEKRGNRRVLIGVVTRDKMNKTRRVEISRLVKHPRYGKYIKRRTVCYVHDENNDSSRGDTVEIAEARHFSKLKAWRLIRVLQRAPGGRGDDAGTSRALREEASRLAQAQAETAAATDAAASSDRVNTLNDPDPQATATTSETES